MFPKFAPLLTTLLVLYGSFKEGVAAVYEAGTWRFIDKTGHVAIAGQFPKVSPAGFQNGVANVCGTKSCGYIDKTGRVIWPWE